MKKNPYKIGDRVFWIATLGAGSTTTANRREARAGTVIAVHAEMCDVQLDESRKTRVSYLSLCLANGNTRPDPVALATVTSAANSWADDLPDQLGEVGSQYYDQREREEREATANMIRAAVLAVRRGTSMPTQPAQAPV